jgi:hypothetical protein
VFFYTISLPHLLLFTFLFFTDLPVFIFKLTCFFFSLFSQNSPFSCNKKAQTLQGKLAQLLPVDMQSREHHLSRTQSTQVLATGSYGPKPKKKVHFSSVWDQWASGAG